MEVALRILSFATYFVLGSWLAYRCVVSTPGDESGKRGIVSKVMFIFVAWISVFVLGSIQTRISLAFFDPEEFSGDRGLPPDVAYDGVGENAFALVFGWILPLICIGIAKLFQDD